MKKNILLLTSLFVFVSSVVLAQHNNELFIQGDVYIQQGVQVHVTGDVHLNSSSGILQNNGALEIEGNLYKDPASDYVASTSGKILLENTNVNIGEAQYIDGNFQGTNAIYNLEINNTASQPVVYLKSYSIEVLNQLILTSGRFKTEDMLGPGFPEYQLIISNADSNAIVGDLINNFIDGELVRAVRSSTRYLFPIGTDDPELFGSQRFELNLISSPNTTLSARFDPGFTTLAGTGGFCDTDEVMAYFPSGNYSVDCVSGQWTVDAVTTGFNYDIEFFPSQELADACNSIFHFLGKDGALLSNCPIPNYAAYNLNDFSVFDIPSVIQPSLPIELAELDAVPGLDYIDVTWKTQTESHFDGFELERSKDGLTFEYLNWIPGQGSESEGSTYHFRDEWVQKDKIYYYRLKMIDQDGAFNYSTVATAIIGSSNPLSETSVYPNPINPRTDDLTFTSLKSGEVHIQLFNSMGQLVFDMKLDTNEGFNHFTLPASLSNGIYHLLLTDDVYVRRSKILVKG